MCAYHATAPHVSASSVETWLAWVGGGERRELDERHERSAHVVAGVIVLTIVALTWSVTTLAVMQATHLPVFAVAAFTLAFALLVGAVSRMTAAGPARSVTRRGVITVGVVLCAIAGEFASLAILSNPIEHQLQQQAARNTVSNPTVVRASSTLQEARDARAVLDHNVDLARGHRDEALMIARCEFHPTPACPQTLITGVPGSGPETRTANDILADSQRELDAAVIARDRRAAELDARIIDDERVLAENRQGAFADADHGLGARWIAMQQLSSISTGTLLLQFLVVGFFAFLALLPTLLRRWRGETTHDRHAQARAERERAALTADTAIAVKQAEIRAATEIMWAEQQLARARLAVEARTEIDRAQVRHQVSAAIVDTTLDPAPTAEDVYLPIAAEAEAASLAAGPSADAEAENLPAVIERSNPPATPTIPIIPDVTRAAARWIRPLVPGFLAKAIDTSTHPLRTARQVIEEVEEITLSLKRTHRVTVHSEESSGVAPTSERRPITHNSESGAAAARSLSPDTSLMVSSGEQQTELADRDGPAQLHAGNGPRQLPPVQ